MPASEMAPCCDGGGRDDDCWYQYGLDDDFPPLCPAPPPLALLRSVSHYRLSSRFELISWRTYGRSIGLRCLLRRASLIDASCSISSLAVSSAEDFGRLPIAAAPPGHLSRSDGGRLIEGSCHGALAAAAADCPSSALMNLTRSVCTLYFPTPAIMESRLNRSCSRTN